MRRPDLHRTNLRVARAKWGFKRGHLALEPLRILGREYGFSLSAGDLLFLDQGWYVTHAGLVRLSHRRRCSRIEAQPVKELCDLSAGRYAFRATVYKSGNCGGFVGYGDADPSNVSPLVHGAEMRVAETRAVNRALRKAYGIGICSVRKSGRFLNSLVGAFGAAAQDPPPPPPPMLELPPQEGSRIRPVITIPTSRKPSNFFRCEREVLKPNPNSESPTTGSHSA